MYFGYVSVLYERLEYAMITPKYKHFKFEDRYIIQEFLNFNYSFTAIATRLGKDRRAISKEVFKHRFLKTGHNSPYEAALGFIGKHNMNLLDIQKINNDDINLSIRLLKR